MASRVPQRKQPRKRKPKGNLEDLARLFEEIGPQPELAEAIEKAYLESHGPLEKTDRGRSKRRRSTRTS